MEAKKPPDLIRSLGVADIALVVNWPHEGATNDKVDAGFEITVLRLPVYLSVSLSIHVKLRAKHKRLGAREFHF